MNMHEKKVAINEQLVHSRKHGIFSLLLSFWTLSIVRISTNRKHNVSETGSVSVFRREGGAGTYSTEKPKACLSTGDARTKEGQPLETRGL
jgi:hypothetical protein